MMFMKIKQEITFNNELLIGDKEVGQVKIKTCQGVRMLTNR